MPEAPSWSDPVQAHCVRSPAPFSVTGEQDSKILKLLHLRVNPRLIARGRAPALFQLKKTNKTKTFKYEQRKIKFPNTLTTLTSEPPGGKTSPFWKHRSIFYFFYIVWLYIVCVSVPWFSLWGEVADFTLGCRHWSLKPQIVIPALQELTVCFNLNLKVLMRYVLQPHWYSITVTGTFLKRSNSSTMSRWRVPHRGPPLCTDILWPSTLSWGWGGRRAI